MMHLARWMDSIRLLFACYAAATGRVHSFYMKWYNNFTPVLQCLCPQVHTLLKGLEKIAAR